MVCMRVMWVKHQRQTESINNAGEYKIQHYVEDNVYFERQRNYYARRQGYDWRVDSGESISWLTFEQYLSQMPDDLEYTIFDTAEQFAEEHAVEFL